MISLGDVNMNRHDAQGILSELAEGKKIGGKPYSFGHVENVALLAENIADVCSLDSEKAYVFGLLHDIGRFFVVDEKKELIVKDKYRHPIEGYLYLNKIGCEEEARICITHAFLYRKNSYSNLYTKKENEIISQVLSQEYDMYDLLIQLADEMSVMKGWCTLETRLAREAMWDGYDSEAWKKFMHLHKTKKLFDELAGKDIYSLIMNNILFA